MDRLLRFLTVGVANTAIGRSSIFVAMRFLDMGEAAANALGVNFSFFVNRAWTFDDCASVKESLPRWLALAGCSYLSNLAVVLAAYRLLGVDPYLSQRFGVPVYTGIGFLGARHYAFRERATALQES